MKPPYTRDSLERALIRHQVNYSPPDPSRNGKWILYTGTGDMVVSSRDVYLYVVGRADALRNLEEQAMSVIAGFKH